MTEPEHRSVSQANDYLDCGEKYRLKRRVRAWQRPAPWTAQGTAVHLSVEQLERSMRSLSLEEGKEVYRDSYTEEINRLCADTPNFACWSGSGPKYPPETDIERRYHLGLEQVGRYWDYVAEKGSQEPIWFTPDGTPAIELGFDADFGGVKVKGYIDQVIEHQELNTHVRDVKSGNQPGDEFQLSVYAVALAEQYGIEIKTGDYWMGKLGRPTVPYELKHWSRQRLTDLFGMVDEGIRKEEFVPNPEPSKCWRCPVNAACAYRA